MPKPRVPEPARRKPKWRLQLDASRREPLSRYELYSVVVSSLALIVAIAAAALQPVLQARLFNEYAERGLLQIVSANVVSKKSNIAAVSTPSADTVFASQCRICHEIDEDGNLEHEFVLTNIGRRPISGIEVVCSGTALKAETQSVQVNLRSVQTEELSPESRVFKVSGALAPGERIHILAKVQTTASVLVRTEHGDSVALLGPGSGPDFTAEDMQQILREIELGAIKAKPLSPRQ